MSQKQSTGYFDKYGNEIFVGDTVRYQFYGQHYFNTVVVPFKNGFYPFFTGVSVEVGHDIDPKKCFIVKKKINKK